MTFRQSCKRWVGLLGTVAVLVLGTAIQAQATPWTSLSLVSDSGSQATFNVLLNGLEACTANGDPSCDAVTALDFSIAASGSDIIISGTYAASIFFSGGAIAITYWSNPGPDGAPAGAGPGNSVGAVLASVGGTITSTTATTTGRTWASGGFFSGDFSGFVNNPGSLAGTYSGFEGDGDIGGTIPAGYSVGLGQFIVNYSVPEATIGSLLLLGMSGLVEAARRRRIRRPPRE